MTAEAGYPQPTEAALVRQVCDGDASAFRGLVDRYAARLFAVAASLVGSAADAEDLVQETFTGAFRGLPNFEGRSSLGTWLTGILMRQAAVHRRRTGKRQAQLEPLVAHLVASEGASSATGAADARLDVTAAVQALGPDHRDVILLREFEGLSYDEIAQTLGIPRGTVESRLFRARRELQERLKAYLD